MSLRRFVGAPIASVVALVILVGCTPVPPIYATLDGEKVVVLVCESTQVNRMSVKSSGASDDLWAATASFSEIVSGTEIVLGEAPEGFEDQIAVDPALFSTSSELNVDIGTYVDGDYQSGLSATFAPGRLDEASWTAPNGVASTERPC